MSLTSEAAPGTPILVRRDGGAKQNMGDIIARVAKESGVGPIRQLLALLSVRRQGMTAKEFYAHQAYLPDIGRDGRKAFVGEKGSFWLNLKLSPPLMTHMRGFLADKIAFSAALAHLGVPTTRAQAALSNRRELGRLRHLRDETDLLAFLRTEARAPIFGKPTDLFQAIGSVSIRKIDTASDTAELLSGQNVPLSELARDIAGSYAAGFLFEDAIVQHPGITAAVGPAVASVRVVTVMAGDRPEVLYTIWKIPSPTGMSDNFWQSGTMIALPDQQTGTLTQIRRGTGPDTEWIETHPTTGQRLIGFEIPHFAAAKELAIATHAIFPINGVLGWDIGIGEAGPLVIEANENPAHMLYQFAAQRGIRNADFEPVFQRVIDRAKQNRRSFKDAQRRMAKAM